MVSSLCVTHNQSRIRQPKKRLIEAAKVVGKHDYVCVSLLMSPFLLSCWQSNMASNMRWHNNKLNQTIRLQEKAPPRHQAQNGVTIIINLMKNIKVTAWLTKCGMSSTSRCRRLLTGWRRVVLLIVELDNVNDNQALLSALLMLCLVAGWLSMPVSRRFGRHGLNGGRWPGVGTILLLLPPRHER